ncbi:hypothetical protein PV08_10071 [Exophiala spinifera]|uniref:Uncharacterized protein n=1 Tax=Exophiala spinifera TaxID=91928 RepID=A0A0D1ZCK6_9EURO|nr:uncharacterized protein PV08_10071 [Exophiala spinifera]KIW10772.1 hypothetical protein PV08_10071 [Exophiala spinifera]
MEMNPVPRTPESVYSNDRFDSTWEPSFALRSPSRMSMASQADSSAPLGTAGAFKCDIMIKFLRQRQKEKLWSNNDTEEGVVLKRAKNDFICQPSELLFARNGLFEQISCLNVKVAMTVRTDVVQSFLQISQLPYIPYLDGLRIQVLPNMNLLSNCKKHHFAAFIRDPALLVVWHDDPEQIISRAEQIEQHLVSLLWKDDNTIFKGASPNRTPSINVAENVDASSEEEGRRYDDKPRRTLLYQSILMCFVGILVVLTIGLGWRKVVVEVKIDHSYLRLVLAIVILPQIWLGWFFFQTLVNGISQIIGPVNQMDSNSRSFSGLRSKRIETESLPHVTVQCPVYKEGLWSVIDPTMVSIREAISTYEMQGGSVNIFVNDDGMQLLSPDQVKEREEYYEEHNIGWVARPKHNPGPNFKDGEKPFIRPGKFKKASNMNYSMNVSARIEDGLARIPRHEKRSQQDEDKAYQEVLDQLLKEDQGRTWAQGDVRIGDYILIVDSDTRVPADCFLDMVSEMEASPQVAIIQYSSGVMNVTSSFFEKGITFFTNLVYTAIQFAVANGDIAPFVGHNAILRWSAIQDIAYEDDGVEKYWAETTVSEDFDMALRLQSKGYDLRFSTYFGPDGFQEGVSLTVYDELARWEKYAYGCSELIFNPLRYWPTRGPVTPLFRRFMFSSMSLMAKITIMSYIGTYYAIASAWILTAMNYFLIGWFNGYLDHYYVDSFKIYFSIVVVFQALGTISLAVLRYRVSGRSLLGSLFENLKWLPLLTIFLGGISLHVSQAIASHMFSVDMTWGATAKEATRTSFFAEVPVILRRFKFTFTFCLVTITTMIVLAGVGPLGRLVPHDWLITGFTAIWPLALVVAFHFLLPLVLNPGLMQFTF